MTATNHPSPPHTPSLHHAPDREHVIVDMDRLTPDEFMRRHGNALRDLLLDLADVDLPVAVELDGYRKDIRTLMDALGAARDTMCDISSRLRMDADDLIDEDSGDQPVFGKTVEALLSLSDDLDKAVEAADGITLIND